MTDEQRRMKLLDIATQKLAQVVETCINEWGKNPHLEPEMRFKKAFMTISETLADVFYEREQHLHRAVTYTSAFFLFANMYLQRDNITPIHEDYVRLIQFTINQGRTAGLKEADDVICYGKKPTISVDLTGFGTTWGTSN